MTHSEIITISLAIIAIFVSVLTWLFPRQLRRTTPSFAGTISGKNCTALKKFLSENRGKVVYLEIGIDNDPVILGKASEHGIYSHILTLQDFEDGTAIGGIEYALINDKATSAVGMYANGYHYIHGYYLPEILPGIHQGYLSGTLEHLPTNKVMLSSV